MKKFYFLFLFVLGTLVANAAQVTFQFDAHTLDGISPNGIHIAGGFQAAAGFPGDWDPATALLTDDNCDFIYELTVTLPDGTYEFKFVNGNAWGSDENQVPATCNAGNGNRVITVAGNDLTYGPVCFNDCGPCISIMPLSVPVTLNVDMSQQIVGGVVSVAGSFQAAAGLGGDWTPGAALMTDPDGDGTYSINFSVPPGCYQYKFLNGDAWGTDEGVPGACAVGGNREFRANDMGYEGMAVCFAQCAVCPTSVDTATVTFQVDMSRVASLASLAATYGIQGYDLGSVISVAGSFQSAGGVGNNWTPGAAVMTDPDGDGIYSLTVELPEGTYAYKFLNGDAWGKDEGVPGACSVGGNRELVVSGTDDIVLPAVCFGYCDAGCPAVTPPINVTFRVDMNNEVVSANGLYVSGSFQKPNSWVKDELALTDPDGDGIYEYTYLMFNGIYQYKFFNGNGGDADGETYDFETGGCGTGNGLGGYNRLLDLSNVTQDYVVSAYVFNSCQETLPGYIASVENIGAQLGLSVSPNPFSTNTVVRFNNPQGNAYSITVSNIMGQTITRLSNVRGESVVLPRADMTAGIYFVTISNNNGQSVSQKLLVR